MKRSTTIILTFVFILALSTSVFAANPFVDVPANHWAYASVAKLAQAGIVDGYGDGTFIGNNTMTRYEMAQITAKAMTRSDKADSAMKAQIEKLAAEFADELDSLGVRVAQLEKNADNVKIRGEVRYSYSSFDKKNVVGSDNSKIRSRIWLTGQVNDRWNYGAMIQHNGHDMKTNKNEGENKFSFRRAWVDGRIGDVNVTAGRFAYTPSYAVVFDSDADGLKLNYAKGKWDLDLFAMRPTYTNYSSVRTIKGNMLALGGQLNYKVKDGANLKAVYYNLDGRDDNPLDFDIFEFGGDVKIAKNIGLWAEYIRGGSKIDGISVSRNGFAGGLNFGEANKSKPGTFAIRTAYYDVPAAGSITPTFFLDMTPLGDGFKGWQVGATWVPAKNININLDYYDFKTQGEVQASKLKERLLYSYVRFYF